VFKNVEERKKKLEEYINIIKHTNLGNGRMKEIEKREK